MQHYDLALVGGGIVGVSTAWQLQQRFPDARIVLIEKESVLARHQTGHNSGVIHAGVYYAPGSLKADMCRRGAAWTLDFCRENDLPFEQCGKLLVATDSLECRRLEALEERCRRNQIETRRLSVRELQEREPNITGLAAAYVPATGITDYRRIAARMAERFTALGGRIELGAQVRGLREKRDGVQIQVPGKRIQAAYLVVCGGLMADRLARMMGLAVDFRIIPFRGEYFRLHPRHNQIIKHLIYPVPDPDLPFLGVHLTRMIDGSVTVGPNAVLGWKREGYGCVNLNLRDSLDMLSFPGFWKLTGNHFRSGLQEMRDAFYKPGYLARVRKYCPGLTLADLKPYPAGIRAQAVKDDGALVHDFLFAESARSLHVCNAPSPAATSAHPIGEYLCRKVAEKVAL